jgi:hypothetical protein
MEPPGGTVAETSGGVTSADAVEADPPLVTHTSDRAASKNQTKTNFLVFTRVLLP